MPPAPHSIIPRAIRVDVAIAGCRIGRRQPPARADTREPPQSHLVGARPRRLDNGHPAPAVSVTLRARSPRELRTPCPQKGLSLCCPGPAGSALLSSPLRPTPTATRSSACFESWRRPAACAAPASAAPRGGTLLQMRTASGSAWPSLRQRASAQPDTSGRSPGSAPGDRVDSAGQRPPRKRRRPKRDDHRVQDPISLSGVARSPGGRSPSWQTNSGWVAGYEANAIVRLSAAA